MHIQGILKACTYDVFARNTYLYNAVTTCPCTDKSHYSPRAANTFLILFPLYYPGKKSICLSQIDLM